MFSDDFQDVVQIDGVNEDYKDKIGFVKLVWPNTK